MKVQLYKRGTVKRLKGAVRERVRSQGKKSAKGKWWKTPAGARGAGLFYLGFLLINIGRLWLMDAAKHERTQAVVLCSLSLVLAGVTLGQSRGLWGKLTSGGERTVLLFYPMEDGDFYSWATLRFVAKTTWIVVLAAVVYFFAGRATGASAWALRVSAPVAEWLLVLCATLALACHLDKWPRWLPWGMYAAALLLLFLPQQYASTMEPLGFVLPTGWLHWLMVNSATRAWAGWVAVMLVPALGELGWWLWKRLGEVYCALQAPVYEAEDTGTKGTVAEGAGEGLRDLPATLIAEERSEEELLEELAEEELGGATLPMGAAWRKQRLENWSGEVGQYVLQGDWAQGWEWKSLGWIEWAGRLCLNSRENGEAQFLLGPQAPRWSGRWKIAVIATAVAFAATLPGNSSLNVVAALAFAVSIGFGVPLLGGAWPATNPGRISGKFSPIFGCYPLSYWTASWTVYKLNAVRIVAWVPLGMLIGILGARSAHMDLGAGCWLAGRGILLLLALMPVLLAGKFSKGSNDTVNLRLATIPLIGVVIVVLTVEIILGSMAMMMEGVAVPCVAIAGTAAIAWGAWALYGVYYERGRVDLLRERQ